VLGPLASRAGSARPPGPLDGVRGAWVAWMALGTVYSHRTTSRSSAKGRARLAGSESYAPDQAGLAVPDYDYRRECSMDFLRAVEAVEGSLSRHGFSVRTVHDIQATLAAKGFRVNAIRIYEVDAPGDPAAQTTTAAGGSKLAKLMPCRVNVFEDGGHVVVTVLRPTLLCRVFPDEDLDDAAHALERVLVAVVDEAVC
jgi:uncharacterized protein (DUF302 family)